MKRSLKSPSATSEPKPKLEPSSPPSQHSDGTSSTPSPKKKKVKPTQHATPSKKMKLNDDQPMAWNADGREALIQHLIAEGLKVSDKAQLAAQFGVTKSKIHNELSLGRSGNMRDKAAKAVR